jgi:hypothetical protein
MIAKYEKPKKLETFRYTRLVRLSQLVLSDHIHIDTEVNMGGK